MSEAAEPKASDTEPGNVWVHYLHHPGGCPCCGSYRAHEHTVDEWRRQGRAAGSAVGEGPGRTSDKGTCGRPPRSTGDALAAARSTVAQQRRRQSFEEEVQSYRPMFGAAAQARAARSRGDAAGA